MRHVEEDLYFVLDERGHSVHLTDKGVETMSREDPNLFVVPDISHAVHEIERDESLSPKEKIERRRQVEADYAMKSETLHIIHKLLQAHALYEREVDYVVQEGKVLIVDGFTGRLMHGRRWSEGLHQAVEAKESVAVQEETQTLATITIQNYFRMYDKLAGMTGTAETEETEFYQIYKLDVVVIPTNRAVRRVDKHDLIYKTRREKYNAILDEVERQHGRGLPVLVGTVNVDVSETLSRMLKRRGLKHEVLNAKYHQREAEIVAQAGQPAAITIATNMAGRGTDIKLGPGVKRCQVCGISARGEAAFGQAQKRVELQNFQARKKLLEYDDVMNQQREVIYSLRRFAREGGEELKAEALRMVEQAVEQLADGLIGDAEDAHQWDRALMETEFLLKYLISVPDVTDPAKLRSRDDLVHAAQQAGRAAFQAKLDQLGDAEAAVRRDLEAQIRRETDPALKQLLEARLAGMTSLAGQALSQIMLSVIDEKWKDHLYDLDQLRAAIQYRAWGQKDPLIEYKTEAYDMFVGLMDDLRSTFAERWLKLQIDVGPAPRPGRTITGPLGGRAAPRRATPMVASKAAADGLVSGGTATGPLPQPPGPGGVPVAAANPSAGVGRNDPCPCGSGKKFKKCHGAAM